ncbi:COG4223 family protein [Falsirhodobacter sp. alg1]|uniref:COG4223 family protein n=1 Tax=Falsirhodobacter sp. alg1 TaxID=1472418 RepID=UPI0007883B72|nr:hypothetical protein [Falsirhodobacter sp. alg1]
MAKDDSRPEKAASEAKDVSAKPSTATAPAGVTTTPAATDKPVETAADKPATAAKPFEKPKPEAKPEPAAKKTEVNTESSGPRPGEPPKLTKPAEPHATHTSERPVFLPLVLGGVIAAVLGFGLAKWIPGGWPIQDNAPLQAEIQRQAQEITSLRDRVASMTMPNLSPLEERLTALEQASGTTPEVQAQLDDLRARIESGTIAPDLQQAIDQTQRELADARAQAEQLQQQAVETARGTTVSAALARIAGAIDGGTPFGAAIEDLRSAGVEIPAALGDAATGVPSLNALEQDFPEAARKALDASLRADSGASWTDRAGAFFRAQTGARSLTPREGNGADAILSRAESALRGGDVAGALAEIGNLSLEGQAAMSDWRADAEKRTAAVNALSEMSSGGEAQ